MNLFLCSHTSNLSWRINKANTRQQFSLLEIFIQYKEHDCDSCYSRAHRSKSTKINNLNTKCQTAVSPLYFQIVFFSQLFTHTQLLQVCSITVLWCFCTPTIRQQAEANDQSDSSSPVRASTQREDEVCFLVIRNICSVIFNIILSVLRFATVCVRLVSSIIVLSLCLISDNVSEVCEVD